MRNIRVISWNVNGIRSLMNKGFREWLKQDSPDILCLQETRVDAGIVAEIPAPPGYFVFWNYPEKKGYGGVATFSRENPLRVQNDFGIAEFDVEGRVIISDHAGFKLFNVYFPNGKQSEERLNYKLKFYDIFFDYIEGLRRKGEKLVICGDFNTAHKEIDIARPKANEKRSGFLPVERAWMDKLVEYGYIDTFRHFNKEPHHYSWWDLKTGARQRNVGWRIDYFFITENLRGSLVDAFILTEVMGSDHCPVGITLRLE